MLDVIPQQDKIRMQHSVVLHPCVVNMIAPLLDGRNRKDHTGIFAHEHFDKWARKKKSNEELLFQNNLVNNSQCPKNRKKRAPESGFEPESEPRQGSMIGHYTTRAT